MEVKLIISVGNKSARKAIEAVEALGYRWSRVASGLRNTRIIIPLPIKYAVESGVEIEDELLSMGIACASEVC